MYFKNDVGGVSLLVIFASFALLSLMPILGLLFQVLSAASQLNQSADRVALAAAHYLISDPNQACSIGEEIALANAVTLVDCLINDDVVTVKVKSDQEIQFWLEKWNSFGTSRAGIDYQDK